MSYKFQKGDAKLGGAIEASQLTGTLKPSSLADTTTDDIAEGSSAQYYTDARARAAVSVTDSGGDGSMAYNSSTGVLTYTGPSASEVRAHFSGAAGVDLSAGAIAVNVDDSSLEISADALQVKGLGVTNDMLAGSIANAKLANSTISGIALGGTLGALSTGNGLSMTSFDGSAAVSDLTIDLDGATLAVGVSGLKVADGGVDNTQLAADAVDGTKLADDSVDSEHIVDGAVDLAHLAADSVDGSKIADDSVDSEHIAAGAIDFEHFAASSVSGSALANAGVGSAKIAELDNFDTDALSEGASNLYYTDARARAAVSVTDAGGDGSMAYNSSTGVLTYTGPSASEVRAHFSAGSAIGISSGEVAFTGSTDDVSEGSNLYFTDARARAAISGQDGLGYNSSTGVMSFTGSTDDVSEGSNLYYTDARARAAVSVTDAGGDGSMAYDNSTGVLTYTGPSASEVRAHFSAGDAIAISSGEISVDSSIAGHGLNVSSGVLSAQHSVKSIGITNATASYGMNFQSGGTISSTVSVRLPAIVSGTVGVAGDLGKVVMVKAAELSGSGKVTVACAGSSTIDGPTDTSLDIESSAGAVTLMVVSQDGNGIWAIV